MATASPIVSLSPSPSVTATATATPTSRPAPGAPTCRLPVWGSASALEQNQAAGLAGGFVAFPNGVFSLASETVTNRPPEQASGWTYSLGRWLPVAPNAVAPDGSHYAWIYYGNQSQDVHLVNAATGQDRVIAGNTDLDNPVWQSDGLYLVHHFIGTDASHGLVRLDPTTGARSDIPVPMPRLSFGWLVGAGAAWTTDLAPQDPVPSNIKGAQDRLDRYDLETGQLTTWLYRQGQIVAVLGFDGHGFPVVGVYDPAQSTSQTILVLTAPNSGQTTLTTTTPQVMSAFPDQHGVWLAGLGGIYLAESGKSARLLSGFASAMGIGGACR